MSRAAEATAFDRHFPVMRLGYLQQHIVMGALLLVAPPADRNARAPAPQRADRRSGCIRRARARGTAARTSASAAAVSRHDAASAGLCDEQVARVCQAGRPGGHRCPTAAIHTLHGRQSRRRTMHSGHRCVSQSCSAAYRRSRSARTSSTRSWRAHRGLPTALRSRTGGCTPAPATPDASCRLVRARARAAARLTGGRHVGGERDSAAGAGARARRHGTAGCACRRLGSLCPGPHRHPLPAAAQTLPAAGRRHRGVECGRQAARHAGTGSARRPRHERGHCRRATRRPAARGARRSADQPAARAVLPGV